MQFIRYEDARFAKDAIDEDYVKELKTLHSLDEEALRDKLRNEKFVFKDKDGNEEYKKKPEYLNRESESITGWNLGELITENHSKARCYKINAKIRDISQRVGIR